MGGLDVQSHVFRHKHDTVLAPHALRALMRQEHEIMGIIGEFFKTGYCISGRGTRKIGIERTESARPFPLGKNPHFLRFNYGKRVFKLTFKCNLYDSLIYLRVGNTNAW